MYDYTAHITTRLETCIYYLPLGGVMVKGIGLMTQLLAVELLGNSVGQAAHTHVPVTKQYKLVAALQGLQR